MKNFFELRKVMMKKYAGTEGVRIHNRMRGRSTIIALETIASSMRQPTVSIRIVDHMGTPQADRHLAVMISDILEKMELEGFTIGKLGRTLTFRGFD